MTYYFVYLTIISQNANRGRKSFFLFVEALMQSRLLTGFHVESHTSSFVLLCSVHCVSNRKPADLIRVSRLKNLWTDFYFWVKVPQTPFKLCSSPLLTLSGWNLHFCISVLRFMLETYDQKHKHTLLKCFVSPDGSFFLFFIWIKKTVWRRATATGRKTNSYLCFSCLKM